MLAGTVVIVDGERSFVESLGFVQRQVGLFDALVEIHAASGIFAVSFIRVSADIPVSADADGGNAAHAYAAMHVLPALFRGACQLLKEHAQRGFEHLFAGGISDKYYEFVAAVSADDVILPVDVPKLGCDLADPEIADRVSVCVVDDFEIVDVDEHQHRFVVQIHAVEVFAHVFISRFFVQQTGHAVMFGFVPCFFVGGLLRVESHVHFHGVHDEHNLCGNHDRQTLQ